MPLTGKKFLILGADGFVGRNLVRYCQSRGWTHFAVGRSYGDLSDWSNVEAAFRAAPQVDRIFHLVTRQRTGQVQYGIQGELLAINARIHLNVLDAWAKYQPQAKLISAGSSCTYPDWTKPLPESAFGTGEVHPSVLGYAQAKQVLARGSEAYHRQYGLSYLHCIFATLFGPFDHKEADRSHFMGAMIERALKERAEGASQFTVWGNPNTVRELLYVDDQIEAVLAADQVFENCILNCGVNREITIGKAAEEILSTIDWPVQTYSPPDSFQGAGYKMLDSSKFLEMTNFKPRYSITDGIHSLLKAEERAA